MTAVSLVRYPDLRSPSTMTKRGWWLVGLNILIPGSAQLLAGSRRLGRFGVSMTFALWAAAVLTAVVYFAFPRVIYVLGTNLIALTVVQVLLVGYAVLWVFLTLDTLRLVRLIHAARPARPLLAGFALVALFVTAGTAGYGAVITGVTRSTLAQLFSSGQYQEPVNGQYNIMLLGGDAGPDRTGMRPDSISVVSINADSGAVTTIGVPRNFERAAFSEGSPLWGPFPDGYDCGDDCLINYLYTYGEEHPELYPDAVARGSQPGIEATRDAVSGVTGLKIQYYVVIDMQGFAELIDALGGITIDVPARTPIGAITNPKPDYWVEAGPQRMNGQQALWYGRSRFDTTDFDRMARQRQVQEALLTQFEPANILGKFQGIAEAGVQVIGTDVPSQMVPTFVDLGTRARTHPITKLELVPPTIDQNHPDYEMIHSLVQTTIDQAAAAASAG